jgi:hypothetical protein
MLRPKYRGKVNDRRDALYGLPQRIRFQKIAFDGRDSRRDFFAGAYEGAAVHAGIGESTQKARANESGSAGD